MAASGEWRDLDDRRIMVVDDDPVIATLVVRLLRSAGYKPAAVQSPDEALQLAEAFLPDLIISDLQMPGLDGAQFCDLLKSSPVTRHIPVVFLSGHADSRNLQLTTLSGSAAFVAKPFQSDRLLETIHRVLKAHSCPRS
jgi:CheY-like chemotaxis protein